MARRLALGVVKISGDSNNNAIDILIERVESAGFKGA